MFWNEVYSDLVNETIIHDDVECVIVEAQNESNFAKAIACHCGTSLAKFEIRKSELLQKRIDYICLPLRKQKKQEPHYDSKQQPPPRQACELASMLALHVYERKNHRLNMEKKLHQERENMRRLGQLQEKLESNPDSRSAFGSFSGNCSLEDRKTVLANKIKDKRSASSRRIEMIQKDLEQLEGEAVFETSWEICEYINKELGLMLYSSGLEPSMITLDPASENDQFKASTGTGLTCTSASASRCSSTSEMSHMGAENDQHRGNRIQVSSHIKKKRSMSPSSETSYCPGSINGSSTSVEYVSAMNEATLAVLCTELERRGCALSEEKVVKLAQDYIESEHLKQAFQSRIEHTKWFEGWVRRASSKGFPNIAETTSRGEEMGSPVWLHQQSNVDWWFDTTKDKLSQLGVVSNNGGSLSERSKNSYRTIEELEYATKELDWKYPSRVFCTTQVNVLQSHRSTGGLTHTSSKASLRASPVQDRDDEQVALITGHNLLFETLPPIWIVRHADDDQIRSIKAAAATGADMGAINGGLIDSPYVTDGLGTEKEDDAFVECAMKMVKAVYPDVSNEDPSKRVVWFVPQSNVQRIVKLAKACRNTGINVIASIPTAQAASPSLQSTIDAFNRHLETTVAATQYMAGPGGLTTQDKVIIASQVLRKINRYELFKIAGRTSGLRPFSRLNLIKYLDEKPDSSPASELSLGDLGGHSYNPSTFEEDEPSFDASHFGGDVPFEVLQSNFDDLQDDIRGRNEPPPPPKPRARSKPLPRESFEDELTLEIGLDDSEFVEQASVWSSVSKHIPNNNITLCQDRTRVEDTANKAIAALNGSSMSTFIVTSEHPSCSKPRKKKREQALRRWVPQDPQHAVERLDSLSDALLCHTQQLRTFMENGTRSYDASLSVTQFEASLKQMAAEHQAEREYEMAVEEAEQKRKRAIEAAKNEARDRIQQSQADKYRYQTVLGEELGISETMFHRLPHPEDVLQMDKESLQSTAHLILSMEHFLEQQVRIPRHEQTGEPLGFCNTSSNNLDQSMSILDRLDDVPECEDE